MQSFQAPQENTGNDTGNIDNGKGALLKIPPRLQWQNDGGYCGAVSFQSVLLFFGGYASQDTIRKTIGDREILLAENEDKVFEKLKLIPEEWKGGGDYEGHLVWMKKRISQGHPVIGTLCMGRQCGSYDHIVPFIGYESPDNAWYHANDVIIYNPLLGKGNTIYQKFSEAGQGRRNSYSIPSGRQYAQAVLGIVDRNNETSRARLEIDSKDEPNVSTGEKPTTLQGTLHISGLTPGKNYAILRYDDYDNIPESAFLRSSFDKKTEVTSVTPTYVFNDSFSSEGVAIYRVVEAEVK